jgi:hypothetical protein
MILMYVPFGDPVEPHFRILKELGMAITAILQVTKKIVGGRDRIPEGNSRARERIEQLRKSPETDVAKKIMNGS